MNSDNCYTPQKLANFLVSLLPISGTILEPHAGRGAFVKALKEKGTVTAYDIDTNSTGIYNADRYFLKDFLLSNEKFSWIVGNPPFSNALVHIKHALTLSNNVAFLLRLGFLASKKRYEFWQAYKCHKIFVLSERPSFYGGVDKYDYGFFWWREGFYSANTEVVSWK